MKSHDKIKLYSIAYLPEDDKNIANFLVEGIIVRYIYDLKLYHLWESHNQKFPWIMGGNQQTGYCATADEFTRQAPYLCTQDFKAGDKVHDLLGPFGEILEILENGDLKIKCFDSFQNPENPNEILQRPIQLVQFEKAKFQIFKVVGKIIVDIDDERLHHHQRVVKRDFKKIDDNKYVKR